MIVFNLSGWARYASSPATLRALIEAGEWDVSNLPTPAPERLRGELLVGRDGDQLLGVWLVAGPLVATRSDGKSQASFTEIGCGAGSPRL